MDPITIAGYVALILGAILTVFSRIPKQTITNQKDLIASYEKRFKDLEQQRSEDQKIHTTERIENAKAIADLQGQIKVYKELPLQEMASAMQRISQVNESIAASNTLILETLKSSATTLAANNAQLHNDTTATLTLKNK